MAKRNEMSGWSGFDDTPGGQWLKLHTGTRWFWLEWTDMDDACGSDNEGHPRYLVELAEVDISDEPRLAQAIKSCGWNPETPECQTDECKAEAMASYGAKAPLWSGEGNALRPLLREAKKEARLLASDSASYEERMGRPVNAIGSTAREFARGDLVTPIQRGIEKGDKTATLMGNIYNNCGGQTLGGEVLPPFELPD